MPSSGRWGCAMNFVLENDHARISGQMDYQPVSAMQMHAVTLHRRHVRSSALKAFGPAWKTIEKLKDRLVGNGVPEMVAIDKPVQPLHDDVKEGV